ncbi:MAG: hypothetical protein C4321_02485 [Chloroflexota bacterium]
MPAGSVRFDLPTPDPFTQRWWDAARERRLLVMRCGACGRAHFYPRPFCPFCWSEDVHWEETSGRGTVYTYSVVYQNDLPPFSSRVPYVAAIVELAEGPRMMTNIVDCDPAALRVGMPVEVTFRDETDEVTLPVFRPAGVP